MDSLNSIQFLFSIIHKTICYQIKLIQLLANHPDIWKYVEQIDEDLARLQIFFEEEKDSQVFMIEKSSDSRIQDLFNVIQELTCFTKQNEDTTAEAFLKMFTSSRSGFTASQNKKETLAVVKVNSTFRRLEAEFEGLVVLAQKLPR